MVAKHKIRKEKYIPQKTCDKYNIPSTQHKIKNTAVQISTIKQDKSTHTVNENVK